MKPNNDQIQSAMRTLLKAAGGYFVAKGTIDGNTLEIILSAFAILIPSIWSHFVHADDSTPPPPTITGSQSQLTAQSVTPNTAP